MKGKTGTSMGGKIIRIESYDRDISRKHRKAQRLMERRIEGFLVRKKYDLKSKTVVIKSDYDNILGEGWLKGYTMTQLLEAYARFRGKDIRRINPKEL